MTTVPTQAPARLEADADAPDYDFDGEAARIAAARLLSEGHTPAEMRAYAETRSELGYMWRRIASAMEEAALVPGQAAAPDLEAVPA